LNGLFINGKGIDLMRIVIALIIISLLTLTGCQQEVKQYDHGKLVFQGTVDKSGVREKGKLFNPKTGKVIFDGVFRNGLMFKGTLYNKNGKHPHPYQE
jgi:hypothetical protein